MKKTVVYLALIASLNSCSQKKENIKEIKMDITSNNIADKINEQVKHYSAEPIYYLYVANSLCVYEILVNDYPIHQNYKYQQQGTPIYINKAILKSGTQKITYRIYPAPVEFNGGSDVFDVDTQFNIKVCTQNLKVSDSHEVLQQEKLPVKEVKVGSQEFEKETEFIGKGQKYYEHTFYFNAKVPYEIEGWSKGQDLRKIDPDVLKEWVVKFYNLRKKTVESNDKDALARQCFEGLKEQFVSEYQTKAYINDAWKEFIETYDNTTYEVQPFENYKMEIFGDGRLVCLRQKSTDVRQREKSALWGKYKDENGDIIADFHKLYLFIPEGEGLNYIQMIR